MRPRALAPWITLVALLAASPACAQAPAAGRSLVGALLTLVEIARDEGIDLTRARVRWDEGASRADVELEADTALWKLTPYLMMAAGPTQIDRIEAGRRVSLSVVVEDFTPAVTAAGIAEAAGILARPGLRERRLRVVPGSDEGPATLRLRATLPLARVPELHEVAEAALGAGALTDLALDAPFSETPRLSLGGPWTATEPGPEAARKVVTLASWGEARARAGDLPRRPARLEILETAAGAIVMDR